MIRILKHKTNSSRKFGDTYVFSADTINQNFTLRWFKKPIEILHKRSLASTVLTHYSHEFAITDLKRHAFQGFNACLISEIDVFDLYQRRKTSFKY
jgi:hypothetical protein